MAYVVAAIWTAKEGQEEKILEVIKQMTPLSRQEPACLYYQAQRSPSSKDAITGWFVCWKCRVAWRPGELSQQPT